MLKEHIKNIQNEITEYKKAMDDDFSFKEEKVDQTGGPETSKVDQKSGPETRSAILQLISENASILHAKWLTNWVSIGALCLSILRKCKTTTSFAVRVHRSLATG